MTTIQWIICPGCGVDTPQFSGGKEMRILYTELGVSNQIPRELRKIQVDPDLIPEIRAVYTQDVAEKMGHLSPDEKQQLEKALQAIDEEEARMARLYAIGKISEFVWDGLWREWQDRRNQIRIAIESLQAKHEVHITNLDAALRIIAQAGIVYNTLERSDQKELLRHMVERVIIDPEGTIRLELRTPFAYLRDISDKVRGNGGSSVLRTKAKADSNQAIGSGSGQHSDSVLLCGEGGIRTHDGVAPVLAFQASALGQTMLPLRMRRAWRPLCPNHSKCGRI